MNILIEKASYIISPYNGRLLVDINKDILIENGFITCIEEKCGKPRDTYVINGYNKLITPGFINTGMDLVVYYIQDFLLNLFSQDFFNKIVEAENELVNEEIVKYMSRVLCTRLLLSGFTGFLVSTSYPHVLVNECREYGMYIATGIVKGFRERIDLTSFKTICSEYGRCIPVYTIYDPMLITNEDFLDEINNVMNMGFKIRIEASRTKYEVFSFKKNTGKWFIEYLYSKNLINKNTLLTHLNWITSAELDYLKNTGVYISLSPSTTLFIGERGFPPVFELMNRDIPLTIGFSGLMNSELSMFDELKKLFVMYRYLYGDNRVDPVRLMYNILYYPYLFLGLGDRSLYKYSIADIIVIRSNIDHFKDIVSKILLDKLEVEYVIVGGYIKLSPENRFYFEKNITENIRLIRNKIYF
uniref:Amidohydrolase-related domain-containing protein n=1 Tax=Staphylothermus marinus TaxID=2280 RepID=A0A7C4H9J4_STAMA